MNFVEAINSTKKLKNCLKDGLQALKGNSNKIQVDDTRDLEGSVDIDTCLEKDYPNASRWDYVFGYKDKVYYVEVHQAKISEVKKVVEKVKWLKKWLKESAKNLETLETSGKYYWIATGRIDRILPRSAQARMLVDNEIEKPQRELNLP